MVAACAADLPADERLAMVEDSVSAARAADPAREERDQLAACLEAYNTQFHPESTLDSAGTGDELPPELREAVRERD